MKQYLLTALTFAGALYLPFLVIVRDPFSSWWSWIGIPGWPVQIVHSNDSFAIIGGTILTFVTIGALSWFSATHRKRVIVSSVVLLCYSIGSAFLIQAMIHAG
jgi:hypothetical protein